MLPIERQQRIKQLIRKKKNLKISTLSQLLNVSEMTIHRDLKPLLDEGYVLKTFGGICLNEQTDHEQHESHTETCVICMRPAQQNLVYRIVLHNGTIEMACCAHCGLIRHHQLKDEIIQALTLDFLTQKTFSAPQMHYVMDTSIHVSCCQPQVLAFQEKEHANKFIKGFGGNVYPFTEAVEIVHDKMSKQCCSSLNDQMEEI